MVYYSFGIAWNLGSSRIPGTVDDYIDYISNLTLLSPISLTSPLIELLDSINKDTGRYLRHSLRSANPNSYTPTPNGGGSSSSSGFTAKDETIPEKVQQDFIEVDRLAEEKIKLAARLNRLLARARARLDHDLKKVLILQGDLDPNQAPPTLSMASSFTPGLSAAASIGVGAIGVGGAGAGVGAIPVSVGNGGMGGAVASGLSTGGVHGTIRNPVQMMNDSLRNALAGAAVLSEQPQPQHQHTITSIPAATASNKRQFSISIYVFYCFDL